MADQNIKDFTQNWIIFGLLFFFLMSFTLTFFYNNNPDALGSSESNFNLYADNMSSTLIEVETTTNEQINISGSQIGSESEETSRVSAATSYGFWGTASSFWENSKGFMSWILGNEAGLLIITVLGGIIGIRALFWIFKLGSSFF